MNYNSHEKMTNVKNCRPKGKTLFIWNYLLDILDPFKVLLLNQFILKYYFQSFVT